MNILVVDDEPLARQRLIGLLQELGRQDLIREAGNGRQALDLVQADRPDLLLLDIRMPVMDGLELAGHLAQLADPPAVVFVTAYDQHALAAFDAQAVDYLLKPIRLDRLRAALDKVGRFQAGTIAALRDQTGHVREHISATMRGRMILVPVHEIRYFQADHKYVTVGHPDTQLLIEEPLKALETEFADRFIRIHRNALIAPRFATEMTRDPEGRYRVSLDGVQETLEVSRRLAAAVKKLLQGRA